MSSLASSPFSVQFSLPADGLASPSSSAMSTDSPFDSPVSTMVRTHATSPVMQSAEPGQLGTANQEQESYHPKWSGASTITLKAESTLFIVPLRLLRCSERFKDTSTGLKEVEIPVVCDATAFELESLLTVLDTPDTRDLGVNQWEAVLHLATKWGFAATRDHAITVFDTQFKEQNPFSRLELALTCKVAKWFKPVYRQLCERTSSLTLDEAERLGIQRYVAITRIREEIHRRTILPLIESVDNRLACEQVHLEASYPIASKKGSRRGHTTAYGTPFADKHICQDEAEKIIAQNRLDLGAILAEVEELQVPF
ncbi:hypothetical protein FRB94_005676 [Tulasnella sp. JGI-2019a]|nr:hypothetical protein FRB94_005676 [Tulasnella sp. JGI-2019a]